MSNNILQYTLKGTHTITFQLPQNPTPDFVSAGVYFGMFNWPWQVDGVGQPPVFMTIWNSAQGDGIGIYGSQATFQPTFVNTDGPGLNAGTEAFPNLKLGTFSLIDAGGSVYPGPFTCTVSLVVGSASVIARRAYRNTGRRKAFILSQDWNKIGTSK